MFLISLFSKLGGSVDFYARPIILRKDYPKPPHQFICLKCMHCGWIIITKFKDQDGNIVQEKRSYMGVDNPELKYVLDHEQYCKDLWIDFIHSLHIACRRILG